MSEAFIIQNAKLRGRDGLYDIAINNGKFTSIAKATNTALKNAESFNAKGRLVTEQFCENHIHLDYAFTAGIPRENLSGTLFEAIEIWRERKELGLNNAKEIRTNALRAIRACVQHGTGFIRTHVDVTDPDLVALKAMLAVKAEVQSWCQLQIVAFPQNGIFAFKNGDELMKKAMEMGADVVGGIPHLEPTYDDGVKSLKLIFDLAEAHNALVDVHCDEIDDSQSRFIDVIAAESTKRGLQGRVTVSHAVAMAYYPTGYLDRLMPKLKAAGVGFAIAPRENLQLQGRGIKPVVPRGVAPVQLMVDSDMTVAFCQDSICDPWYPIGDGNPIRNMDTGMHVAHMLTATYMDESLDFVTVNPAKNMGLDFEYGIKEGFPAHCIVLDAKSDREVLQSLPMVLLSIHKGREVFRRQESPITWAC